MRRFRGPALVDPPFVRTLHLEDQMETLKQEHKKQLHDLISERCIELKATLGGLQGDPQSAKSERADAVEAAMAALRTHLTGGWDSIDGPESGALTRWLELSQFLCD
jgi:hypothetical protein